MCNFGSRAEWRNGRRSVSSYLDVDILNDQDRLVNTTLLDCIACYIMEYAIGDRALKRLPQLRLNLIDGYISSYCYIFKPFKQLHIDQASKRVGVCSM